MNIEQIQQYIALEKADAWVMVDYENRNPAMTAILGPKMLTRKIFMVIPATGRPFLITHTIDTVYLQDEQTSKNFDLHVYKTWGEMLELEKRDLSSYKKVLMDVSEKGLLPRVSLADWGSVEFIRGLGLEISSSQNVLQRITAVYSDRGYELQLEACSLTLQIKDEAFRKIRELIETNGETNEYEIQQFIARRFAEEGMVYDEAPLVAIGKNASNPHYSPTKDQFSPIRKGDLVLIDMWAKMDDPEAVYADITWMGYVGKTVPAKYENRFEIVKNARDAVIDYLAKAVKERDVMAYEADDVARQVITEAGYGEYFVHRVGHNIAADVSPHGSGANLDNFETHDTRYLIEGTSFSDEPGIYAPDFGVRSETNLHIINGELEVVAGLQEDIIPILNF